MKNILINMWSVKRNFFIFNPDAYEESVCFFQYKKS